MRFARFALLASFTLTAVAQRADAQAPVALRVSGDVARPLTLSLDDLATMPRTRLSASDHGKPTRSYVGVLLSAVLERAGIALGKELKGSGLATAIVVDAADGYRAAFGIAEFDSAFTDHRILLVDAADGKALGPGEGPLRLVIGGEPRPARWVRQVTGVRVIAIPAASGASR